MPFEISSRMLQNLSKQQKTPAIVVLFDEVETPFTSVPINTYTLLDDGYFLDEGLFLDELAVLSTQISSISFSGGSNSTTTKIDYKIDPDYGFGESVTSLKLSFVNDKKNTMIGQFNDKDFLGRKVRVKMTVDAPTAIFPRDYLTIFRGIVDEVSFQQGMLTMSVSHPDQKKRQTILVTHKTKLTAAITNSQTTIPVIDSAGFYYPITGPDGNIDAGFKCYMRIEDEIIQYTGNTLNDMTGCVRASLSTTAVSHVDESEVTSYYVIEGNAMDIALKLMLSGWGDSFVEAVPVSTIYATNTLVFDEADLVDQYGITVGDFITTTLATAGANNVTLKPITAIAYDEETNVTTLTIGDVTFTNETVTSCVVAFRSQYDTYPSGLKMYPDEVDVAEHLFLKNSFLYSADYLFYIKDTIDDAKDFLAQEVYKPIACYSLPKNTQASVGYTIPPLPDIEIETLNTSNVIDPKKIKHFRQLGRNFYNTILYKYDEDELEDGFNNGIVITDSDSTEQIKVGVKVFTIESKGLRAGNIANSAAQRRLNRYRFAAAQIQGLRTNLKTGFKLDIGDSIIIDGDSLLIPDLSLGTTTFGTRLFQIVQKSIDIRTGEIQLTVLDTSFSLNARYGYISPSSEIVSVASDKQFTIQSSFSSELPEYKKWEKFKGATIKVRNADHSVSATGTLFSIGEDNVITLEANLASTPTAGMYLEFSDYDDQASALVKLLYTHITDGSNNFADGGYPYYMI